MNQSIKCAWARGSGVVVVMGWRCCSEGGSEVEWAGGSQSQAGIRRGGVELVVGGSGSRSGFCRVLISRTSCPSQLRQKRAFPSRASSRSLVALSHSAHTELLDSCLVVASFGKWQADEIFDHTANAPACCPFCFAPPGRHVIGSNRMRHYRPPASAAPCPGRCKTAGMPSKRPQGGLPPERTPEYQSSP